MAATALTERYSPNLHGVVSCYLTEWLSAAPAHTWVKRCFPRSAETPLRNHSIMAAPSGRWLRVEASGEIGAAIDTATDCCEPACIDVLTNENTALVVPR